MFLPPTLQLLYFPIIFIVHIQLSYNAFLFTLARSSTSDWHRHQSSQLDSFSLFIIASPALPFSSWRLYPIFFSPLTSNKIFVWWSVFHHDVAANNCAEFHGDSPSGKKVKFNLASAIELSEMADFVYNCVKKPYTSEQLRWPIWRTFLWIFLCNFHRRCLSTGLYQGAKKWKMTKNSNQGVLNLVQPIIRTDINFAVFEKDWRRNLFAWVPVSRNYSCVCVFSIWDITSSRRFAEESTGCGNVCACICGGNTCADVRVGAYAQKCVG